MVYRILLFIFLLGAPKNQWRDITKKQQQQWHPKPSDLALRCFQT